jgi:hypothetical protein
VCSSIAPAATPEHSAVRLASGGDRLTFASDAVFQVGFEHPGKNMRGRLTACSLCFYVPLECAGLTGNANIAMLPSD